MSVLNINTAVINAAREATRSGQRGMARLQRKVRSRDAEIERLNSFLESRQLTEEYRALQERVAQEKYGEWMAKDYE